MANGRSPIGIFLAGDVMTGRAIDQVLEHPGDPTLHEPYVLDAREYVQLAEHAGHPVPRPVAPNYIWGEALAELHHAAPDVRIINLETSVTTSDAHWPDKSIHYRMHPANIGVLTAAKTDCCCLANNHVLDWGHAGLHETLTTLCGAGLGYAGAGRDADEAARPAVIEVPGKGRVVVVAMGVRTSGIFSEWAAHGDQPGVHLLPDLSLARAQRIADDLRALAGPDAITVASIHWGGNWGYPVPDEHVAFAHELIDHGVDIVHGHSSHHVKAVEIYRRRPIIYGAGEFIDDYEGIGGHEAYRPDLVLMYFASLEPGVGLMEFRLVPMRIRQFRLRHASERDSRWLADLLTSLGKRFRTRITRQGDGSMLVHGGAAADSVGF